MTFIPRTIVMLVYVLVSGPAIGQSTNNNYYEARSSSQLSELLAAVEKHHEQQGIDKMRSRFYPGAWGDFNFMLNYFPNHPRALLLMGQLCERWPDPKCNMSAYFDKALQKSPDNEGVHLTYGVYLQKHGKLGDAIESYKKALEINPNSANTHYNLGLAYLAQKDFDLANKHAQQAYALGIPLPGLQQKLMAAKSWKPLPPITPQNSAESALPPEKSIQPEASDHENHQSLPDEQADK